MSEQAEAHEITRTWPSESKTMAGEVESRLRIPVGTSTEMQTSVTGEQYVTICSGGVKPEGNPMPAWYATHELAREAYIKAVLNYGSIVANADGQLSRIVLYWRTPPEMESLPGTDLFSVYSRLLISAKPSKVDRHETEVSYLTGATTRIEPYDFDDRGRALNSGQRCKVTIEDAEPILIDRVQILGWLDYMDKWSKQ